MKTTPWFPADVKPVRKGWYEVECSPVCHFHYWTGRYWSVTTPKRFSIDPRPWRGIAK